MAVTAPRRRADGNEYRLRARHRASEIGGERQSPRRDIAPDELVESRLVDRHPPRLERRDLRRVLVDAHHIVPEVRQTRPRHQADIARTDHHDMHEKPDYQTEKDRRLGQQLASGKHPSAAIYPPTNEKGGRLAPTSQS